LASFTKAADSVARLFGESGVLHHQSVGMACLSEARELGCVSRGCQSPRRQFIAPLGRRVPVEIADRILLLKTKLFNSVPAPTTRDFRARRVAAAICRETAP